MATLTLKNVPDGLVRRLKERAARHRRSLNQEAIVCLEEGTGPMEEQALLQEIKAAHAEMAAKGVWVTPEEVDRFINEGRE